MSRGTRTLIVLAVAVIAAAAASYGVYTAVQGMPARTVEIATRNAVVAKKGLPVGTLLTSDSVKVVQWPEKTPVTGGFADMAEVVDRGLVVRRRRERADHRKQAGAEGGGRGSAADDHAGHARHRGTGQRSDRRGRVRRAGHARRRHDHHLAHQGRTDVARRRQQRAGARGGHAHRPGRGEGRQSRSARPS